LDIRRALPTDREGLFDIWLRSVRATHTFVTEDDIQAFIPLVREYLASAGAEFWVLRSDDGTVMGFMGMDGHRMESLR
jgi:putative acetyltransferase